MLFLAAATASAAVDPLAANLTGGVDELQLLLAGEEMGFVNRSAEEGIFNQSRYPATASPPFYHLMRNESIFRDFENLTGTADPVPLDFNATMNGSFFEMMIEEWW
ncbi:hypothetical protein [Methanocrinis sp.]|uniref:hypothetical protein n=1 Tax=Methanocrinis sp. TaxID=3101522 RepID=UPI003D141305